MLLVTTFDPNSPWGAIVNVAMMDAEIKYCRHLLEQLEQENVPGCIVEFGVFNGMWLSHFSDFREELKSNREVWGFDSFEGLPKPTENDLSCFHEGDFLASYENVRTRLLTSERSWIKLKKGWFKDTIALPDVQDIAQVAYARIDCDLYQGTVECLQFLSARLVDGAILVFDDWTYDPEKGETKAYCEWSAAHPEFSFEFLTFNSIGHLYLRVSRI